MAVENRRQRSLSTIIFGHRGGLFNLFLSALLPCIPVVVVTGLLLGIIFHYQIDIRPGLPMFESTITVTQNISVIDQIKSIYKEGGSEAYFVQYNPSSLTTIAAWTGRVIPYLSTSFMALVAFFAAHRIAHHSNSGQHNDLPSPSQMTVLIDLLNGSGIENLWNFIVFKIQSSEVLSRQVHLAFVALLWVTLIGFLIPAADTWLGIATSPTSVTVLKALDQPLHSYGRGFPAVNTNLCADVPDDPTKAENNEGWPCNIHTDDADGNSDLACDVQLLFKVQNRQNNSIFNLEHPAAGRIEILADLRADSSLDFEAESFGVSTQCKIINSECEVLELPWEFFCTDAFKGNLTRNGPASTYDPTAVPTSDEFVVGVEFLANKDLSSKILHNPPLPGNPAYFAMWSSGIDNVFTDNEFDYTFLGNNDTIQFGSGDTSFISCNTTIWDVTYTWVNGNPVNITNLKVSNSSMGAFFLAPYVAGTTFANTSLLNSLYPLDLLGLAVYVPSDTQLLSQFAQAFSYDVLALSAGVLVPHQNLVEQSRMVLDGVARVPKAPLYLLVMLQFLYAAIALLLAAAAFILTKPSEAHQIKSVFSVRGLASQLFDADAAAQAVRNQHIENLQKVASEGSNAGYGDFKRAGESKVTTTEVEGEAPEKGIERSLTGFEASQQPKIGVVKIGPEGWKFVWGVQHTIKSLNVLVQAVSTY